MGRSVAALVARMGHLLAPLEVDRDPARFFLGVYLRTTVAVGAAIDAGGFEDPAWVEEWDVDFAGLYLDALTAHRRDPASPPRPWRLAFGARPDLPPEAHVLLGMNAHINFDLPQSLVRVIPPADFDDPATLDRRRRDHERIDRVLASRVAAEDGELHRAGGRRTRLDRVLAPVNRTASQMFLRESRRKVWANAAQLDAARRRGSEAYARRVADLEAASAARVDDLLRPGPVLVRLAAHGFGVALR
ncbi:hypothetical protein E4P41_11025 [Geodermatophilus sp. DF01-2]|uniref:DUF5995 family protein n=1 Tax=Geodermatophilus sp. DF01-2 TaxID=2559610 RepID=UPI0010734B81|nr:DUF5995 family protein [Geodermatophilus sp. DF01_2]TFV60140.1 hypothetical protein E4P41_11025 [Geodermatophilus sp. DF01_2]